MCPLDCEKDVKLKFPFQSTLFIYEFGKTLVSNQVVIELAWNVYLI